MSKEKRKRCKISKLFRLYVSFSEGVFPAFLSFFNPYLWEVPLSWIVPSHHRSQEYYRGVYHRSITEEYYRGYGIQTQRNSGAAPRQCTGEGTYLKRRHMAKKFLVFLTLRAPSPNALPGREGEKNDIMWEKGKSPVLFPTIAAVARRKISTQVLLWKKRVGSLAKPHGGVGR